MNKNNGPKGEACSKDQRVIFWQSATRARGRKGTRCTRRHPERSRRKEGRAEARTRTKVGGGRGEERVEGPGEEAKERRRRETARGWIGFGLGGDQLPCACAGDVPGTEGYFWAAVGSWKHCRNTVPESE